MIKRPDDDAYEAGAVPIVRSAWVAGDAQVWPALTSDIDVDVVVVGSGVVGASVALHLAERGVRVALIEARRYIHGSRRIGLGRFGGIIIT